MADATVTTGTELKNAVGYWDDSGGVRIAGTAGDGDTVTVNIAASTVDLTATDNILYPALGVTVIGRTDVTFQGRLYVRGSGGIADYATFYDVNLDAKGYGAITAGGLPLQTGVSTCFAIDQASFRAVNCNFTDSIPATSNCNLFTQFSDDDEDAVSVELWGGTCDGAAEDVVSTKGKGATVANTSSNLLIANVVCQNPGTNADNQAITAHNEYGILVFGGSASSEGAVSFQAIAGDINDGRLDIVNCTIAGKLQKFTKLIGGSVDCQLQDEAISTNLVGDVLVQDVIGTDWPTTASQSCIQIKNVGASTDTVTVSGCLLDEVLAGVGIEVTDTAEAVRAMVIDDNVFNSQRCIDVRNSLALFTDCNITNNIGQGSAISVIGTSTPPVTMSGNTWNRNPTGVNFDNDTVDATASIYSDAITARTTSLAAIAYDSNVYIQDLITNGNASLTTYETGLENGLELHLKMDELTGTDAADSSPNNFTCTLTNTATSDFNFVNNATTGKHSGALDFDGTLADYVDIACAPGDALDLSDNFTVSFTINPNSFASTRWIYKRGTTSGAAQNQQFTIGTTSTGTIIAYFGDGNTLGTEWDEYRSTGTLTVGVTTVVTLRITNGLIECFFDGVQDPASLQRVEGLWRGAETLCVLGNLKAGTQGPLDAWVDDFRIYSRPLPLIDITALSEPYIETTAGLSTSLGLHL